MTNAFLDNNTFLLYNQHHKGARIAMWGTSPRDMGTFKDDLYPDQLWILVPNVSNPTYHQIRNFHNSDYYITKWGTADADVGVKKGADSEGALWKFEQKDDGSYLIHNKEYPQARITKWGVKDSDFGTYAGKQYDDQKWKLVPRFTCILKSETLWKCDNRTCPEAITETVQFVGDVSVADHAEINVGIGFEDAAWAAARIALEKNDEADPAEIYSALQHFHKDMKTSFQKAEAVLAPPGVSIRAERFHCIMASPFKEDKFKVYGGHITVRMQTDE